MALPLRRGPTETSALPMVASPTSELLSPLGDRSRPITQRGESRTGSVASSSASIGCVLDTAKGSSEPITEASPNSISTLLQPPIIRTGLVPQTNLLGSGFKASSARDIPPVTLTNIPHVENKAFQPYLSQIGSLYEAFRRAKEDGSGESQLFRRDKKDKEDEDLNSILDSRLQRPSHSRAGSTTSITPETSKALRRIGGQRRQHAVTPLSTIPAVYSEANFHLENPRTFDIVSERSEIVRDPNQNADSSQNDRKLLATNAILQEKLSWYLDTVEVHLISSISTASKSFFSALGSLRELHSEAADSVNHIQILRNDLAKVDEDMAMGGLKVVNLKRRRDNVRKLGEAIMQLKEIVLKVQQCEDAVGKGEIESALDDLENVENLMAGKGGRTVADSTIKADHDPTPLLDLRNLQALQSASDDLRQLRFRIGKGYETRFLGSLLSDIRRHVDSVPPDTTFSRWNSHFARVRAGQRRAPSAYPAYMLINPAFRSELESSLIGLSKANHTTPAASAFKSAVLRELKSIIRKQLPSSNDDDTESTVSVSTSRSGGRQMSQQEKSSILARNLRALDGADANAMLGRIYAGISEGLRRLNMQVKILLDITSGMGLPSSNDPRSPGNDSTLNPQPPTRKRAISAVQAQLAQILDLSSLLGEAVDIVQSQITKIVKVRSEQTAQLPLADFLQFFSINRLFADECEAISGRTSMALKTVVDSQIKDFVSQFGNTQKRDIVAVMDADKWDAKDFGENEAETLKRVLNSSTSDAISWGTDPTSMSSANGIPTNGASRDRIRPAIVDVQKFILPSSAIALLSSLHSTLYLTTSLPSLSSDLATTLLESLKLFNSRSSQLILGAGATRSAGLKNITTKHLALSSQALSFIVALIPYIREFFRRHLPTATASQTLAEFDKVRRLLLEHQAGIHEKLVEIMASRATLHVSVMKKINWEAASIGVNPYVETLTKETATLQKVLAKHLPEETVASIMQPVFASYREQWIRAYGEVVVRSMAAKERLLADAEFFSNRISRLDGAGDLGEYIVNVVKAKTITIDPSAAKRTSMEKPAPVQAPAPEEEKKSGGQEATSAPAPVPEVGDNEAGSK